MTDNKKAAIKARLTATREQLMATLDELPDENWHSPAYSTEGGQWSVLDVLRHVTDSERGMTALMAQVKAGGSGVSDDFDLNRWNRRVVEKLQDKSAADLRAALETNRAALFAFIDTLEDDDWDKVGRHASGHMMTIEQVCKLIARHERDHLAEIRAAVSGSIEQ